MNILETVTDFQLSRKAREAIKVALAFSIVIIISLNLSWMNPYWAGFAVGQVALFAAGQSLRNGALRVAGVIPAVLVSLLIYALAPQERWLFVTLAASWMMFTTYMMIRNEKLGYLWNVAGFAALAILATHPDSSGTIFYTAMARGLETTLGVVVYTLVTVFVWPDSNAATLKQEAINLVSVQAKIFGLLGSQRDSIDTKHALKETVEHEVQLLAALKHSFYAKGFENYEVQEAAGFWKELYGLSIQLAESFDRLNNSFLGLRNVQINKIVPRLGEYRQEIIGRFELAEDSLQKGTANNQAAPIIFDVDEAYLKSLPPFDQLAFASSKTEFQKVEELSRKILECANNIVDDSVGKKMMAPEGKKSIYERLVPDIDHLKSVLFVGSVTFICFCIWIFFDPPGHMMWMQLPPTVAMIVAATPQMKTNKMVMPTLIIYPFFLMVNMTIMPHLSTITQLAPLLFICMFCVFYFFTGVYKMLGVIAVTTKLMVHNEQTYDFATSANMIILSLGAYTLLYVFSYVLSSPRPQRALLSHIRRYFRSAEFLVSEAQSNGKKGMLKQLQIAFYRYELRTLPLKMKPWAMAINRRDYPKNSLGKTGDLLASLYTLSNSLDEWLRSTRLQQTNLMFTDTREELASWHKGLNSIFKAYRQCLAISLSTRIEDALESHLSSLEAIVNKHALEIQQAKLTPQEKENLFRLIGGYQGLSLSLISYAAVAEQIDWAHWEEEVFA